MIFGLLATNFETRTQRFYAYKRSNRCSIANTDLTYCGLDRAEFPVCHVAGLSCVRAIMLDVQATARGQEVNIIRDLDCTQKELYVMPLFAYDEMAFSSFSCHTLVVWSSSLFVWSISTLNVT
jgi:hypothetical protein